MATNTKSKTTPSNTRSLQVVNARMLQNFHLVWLDDSIDEHNHAYHDSIVKLQEVIHTVNTFVDVDECIDFITDVEEKAFVIISGSFGPSVISLIQGLFQVFRVYMFYPNDIPDEKHTKRSIDINGLFTDITSVCETLKQDTKECDDNSVSISFVKNTDVVANQTSDTLDSSFMYTQILKEILLTIDFDQVHFKQFISYCRGQFVNHIIEMKNVDKFEKEYRSHSPIWWYTYQCFLYSMLNRALRTMEADMVVNMGFFVRDLHQHIAQLHFEQYSGHHHSTSFTVYRGQGLSRVDFDQLQTTYGGLLAFNNYLSTSLNYDVSLRFARRNINTSDQIGVVFMMKIDPTISAIPFANIKDASCYKREEEILFSMHSVFRIGQVKQIDTNNNRLWQVELTLTGDHDPQLQKLTESMRNGTEGWAGWFRLAKLMVQVAEFDKAEQIFQMILDQGTDETTRAEINHNFGIIKVHQGKYANAITDMKKSLQILEKSLPRNHPDLANSYNNIGSVYDNMGEYSKALSYYEKALKIRQRTLPANHPDLAQSYSNIGGVYDDMGEHLKALSYYEKAVEIYQKTLPANHPDLATSYSNIGRVYENMGEYSKELSYYEKALEIRQKTLPANHPHLATSYNNIGSAYDYMGEYSKSLSYYEKALEISQRTLPANHPDLASSYNNIGQVYRNMGKYSEALSSHEKAFAIRRKTLPENHPDLSTSYNNIGGVYDKMGEYWKALSYYEKAFEIFQKTLPANHPYLAASYNNIGSVYGKMDECSKALSYNEKALEILQKTLPANHPDLANSYNNIGGVYDDMGEYPKALSSHEKALEIRQKTLPPNHPDLAQSYNNIGWVYYAIGEYSKALLYLERALGIWQRSLPPDHPHLKLVKNNIEIVKNEM